MVYLIVGLDRSHSTFAPSSSESIQSWFRDNIPFSMGGTNPFRTQII